MIIVFTIVDTKRFKKKEGFPPVLKIIVVEKYCQSLKEGNTLIYKFDPFD